MRITYYKNLYTSPNIRHLKAVKWRLAHHAGNLALWVITVSGGHCMFLHQPWYKKRDLLVIGLAEGRAEAIDLIQKITEDCIAATGGTDLKAFLFPEAQEGQPPAAPRELLVLSVPGAGRKPA